MKQSRLGLLMNGLVKIPMQFLILLIGTLVFTFYQFNQPPLFFNAVALQKLEKAAGEETKLLKERQNYLYQEKSKHSFELIDALKKEDEVKVAQLRTEFKKEDSVAKTIHSDIQKLMKKHVPLADSNDSNYVFLDFIVSKLPKGLVGLLMAIIFLADMGSTASGMNSLASATVIDFYKRYTKKEKSDKEMLSASRGFTLAWGLFCIAVAFFASKLGNLIEAVNSGITFRWYNFGHLYGGFFYEESRRKIRFSRCLHHRSFCGPFLVARSHCFFMAESNRLFIADVTGCPDPVFQK